MRERVAHAVHCFATIRDTALLLLEHLAEDGIAGSYDCDHIQPGCDEIARRMRGDCDTILQGVQQFAAAETCAGTAREQHGNDALILTHVADYAGWRWRR